MFADGCSIEKDLDTMIQWRLDRCIVEDFMMTIKNVTKASTPFRDAIIQMHKSLKERGANSQLINCWKVSLRLELQPAFLLYLCRCHSGDASSHRSHLQLHLCERVHPTPGEVPGQIADLQKALCWPCSTAGDDKAGPEAQLAKQG